MRTALRRAPSIKVTGLKRHRNGVGGIGFTLVSFEFDDYGDKHKAIATVFDHPNDHIASEGHCAVITLDSDGRPEVNASWRGDVFEEALRKFIASPDGEAMIFPT